MAGDPKKNEIQESLTNPSSAPEPFGTVQDGRRELDDALVFHEPRVTSGKEGSDLGESEMGDTLGLPPRSETAMMPRPPVAALRWDRYSDFTFLGQGGMGSVFAAYDRQLQRRVAVKFLHKQEPHQVRRFMQEARAQARVQHEHIAQIYDFGELDGQPYIAMQWIDGQTLDKAAEGMSLEKKLVTMKKVAEGVHAAHIAGLIHRDLKPGNILVDKDGQPHVLDFGLARLEEGVSLTADGTVLGTPSYMAPEQARGEVNALDRRTDVYALGATLYHMVTGRTAFPGTNQAAVLVDILAKTPTKPSLLAKGLPADVETIITKCMEKEALARYDSVRALAEDLGRYLQGEPIQARPPSFWYRMGKRARKNRTLVRLAAVAAVLLILALSWGIRTAWQASIRENLARDLTREVEEIDALARFSYMARRHDIRPDRERIRGKMDRIVTMGDQAGTTGVGPTHYALGRGYLALEELDLARSHLNRAWQDGFRKSEVAYALGLAYGGLFRRHSAELYLLEEGEPRLQKLAELERHYRDPALHFIRQTHPGDAVSPAYLQALIAFYQGDYQAATDLVATVSTEKPWYFEAKKLEADIWRDWAAQKSEVGQVAGARDMFARASASYAMARDIAQSHPLIYKDHIRAILQMVAFEIFAGEEIEPLLREGQTLVEYSLQALPEDDDALLLAAQLYFHSARQSVLREEDPGDRLERAVSLASRARDLSRDASPANLLLGRIYWRQAQWITRNKHDAREKTRLVLATLDEVAPSHQDHHYFNTIGLAAKSLANWLNRSGEPACHEHDRAIDAFRGVIRLQPKKLNGYNNLAGSLVARSGWGACSGEALDQLNEAAQALRSALEINPNHPVLYYQLGRTYMRMARRGIQQSGNLNVELAETALDQYRTALDLNPKISAIYNAAGLGYVSLARHAWHHGGQAEPFFQKAFDIYRKGLEISPESRFLMQNLAWAYYYQGKIRCRTSQDPTSALDLAVSFSRQALAKGEAVDALLCLGSAYRMKAEYSFMSGKDPSVGLQQAQNHMERILAINGEFTEAYRSLGRIHTLKARWLMQQRMNPQPAFSEAWAAIEQALQRRKELVEPLTAAGRLLIWQGIWMMDRPEKTWVDLEQGMAWADLVLESEPNHVEALAIKACFSALNARVNGRSPLMANSQLEAVLAANPNQASHWRAIFSSIADSGPTDL